MYAAFDLPLHQRGERGLVDTAIGAEGRDQRGAAAGEIHSDFLRVRGHGKVLSLEFTSEGG